MKAVSLGVVQTVIGGINLGSVTDASIDLQFDLLPTHGQKVGNAQIVGSEFKVKSIGGSMSVTLEEVGLAAELLDCMTTAVRTGEIAKRSFSAYFPGSGGSISGELMLMPQFSTSVALEGWSTISLQPLICGPIVGLAGLSSTHKVGGVPFMDVSKKGTLTKDNDNLCYAVECNGIGVADMNLSVTSQYRSIYRGNPPWPVDYVLDSVHVSADIGFYDMTELTSAYEEKCGVVIDYLTIGGTKVPLNLGTSCVKMLSGLKSSGSGVNTWRMKVEGNAF